MVTIKSKLHTANLEQKRVFVRADLNTTHTMEKSFKNDFRLQSIVPTLQLLQKKGAISILCSHDGRPQHHEPALSTKQYVSWFIQAGFTATFAPTVADVSPLCSEKKYDLIILENIRFFPEEELCDTAFAQKLATCADYYVNDAFGSCHRTSTTLTVLPTLFDADRRSIGLLIEKELEHLNAFIRNQKHPFTIMLGGTKGETKLGLLHALLPKLDTVLITTPLCFTFFKAVGKEVGKSYTEESLMGEAEAFLQEAKKQNVSVLFPVDFQVTKTSFESPKKIHIVNHLEPDDIGLSVGPNTTTIFKRVLLEAKTLFINGLPGNPNYIETLESSRILLYALQRFNGAAIIGGGDSIAMVHQLGCHDIGFLSTGGGSTLAYLSGQMLPALIMLQE